MKEDALDESVLDVDVSVERPVVVDHPASFEQQFFILRRRESKFCPDLFDCIFLYIPNPLLLSLIYFSMSSHNDSLHPLPWMAPAWQQ